MNEEREQIIELRRVLHRANRAYYVDAAPTMSDEEFDRRLLLLAELEARHPEAADVNSPTVRVGGGLLDGFTSAPHAEPMLSIDNTYDEAAVAAWFTRVQESLGRARQPGVFTQPFTPTFVCEAKIDGLALSLTYIDGKLRQALTRGDGSRGDDVTDAARVIRSIPLILDGKVAPPRGVVEIRGEVYLPLAEFERLNNELDAKGEDLLKNPRNAAAGTLKNLDLSLIASRRLAFLAHGKGRLDDMSFAGTHRDFLLAIFSLGVPIAEQVSVGADLADITSAVRSFAGRRGGLGYATDGLVIRVNEYAYQQMLGSTSKSPRWVIAYKYPAERGATRLLEVLHQVGKTGKITPRAVMEPVTLAGTTVKHATLHNYGMIRSAQTEEEGRTTDLRIGDRILVEKAGEIIPQVVGVVLAARPVNAREIVAPAACPECQGPVEVSPPEAAAEPALETVRRCINPQCPAQVRERLIWFAGRKQMDISGLGEKTVDQIRAQGRIALESFADIFRLHRSRALLLGIDRMGEKKVDNLLAGIEEAKGRGLAKVLSGMGMRHVGDTTGKLLARCFASYDDLMQASELELRPRSVTKEEARSLGGGGIHGDALAALMQRETGLGKETAPAVYAYLHSEVGKKAFAELAAEGVDLTSREYQRGSRAGATDGAEVKGGAGGAGEASGGDRPLAGRTIVITGSFDRFDRMELSELLERAGARMSGSVSKKTSLVVAGTDAGSKLSKAQELGVEVWEEAAVVQVLRGAGLIDG